MAKKADQIRYWKCPCGKRHVIDTTTPIRCEDAGHSVYISPAYWTYDVNKPQSKPSQTTLF